MTLRVLLSSLVLIAAMSGTWTPMVGYASGGDAYKLRKLHLVRPDLIPYPLFVDYYC